MSNLTDEDLRHQRKMSKRRVRAREKQRLEDLTRAIEAIKLDLPWRERCLAELQEHYVQQRLAWGASPTAEHVIRHAFELFRHGYNASLEERLHEAVHPNVCFMGGGLAYLKQQWTGCCEAYDNFTLDVVSVHAGGHPRQLIVQSVLSVGLSQRTLEVLFPHLFRQPKWHDNRPLADKLMSTPLVLPLQCHLWLDPHFRVVRLEYAVGWVHGLLQVLGTIDAVALVLCERNVNEQLH